MKTTVSMLALAVMSLCMISCSNDGDNVPDDLQENVQVDLLTVSDEGISLFALNNICPVLTATEPLTAEEIEFLYTVREDEKLSHDLYAYFSAQYPAVRPFANIREAEANHTAAVERLFTYYEIDFPSLGETGIFVDEARQATYDLLITGGSTLVEACRTLASEEEKHLVAYSRAATGQTNENIRLVMSNLAQSSENHLKVLVGRITALGETYAPSLLNDTQYKEILDSTFKPGNSYGVQGEKGKNTNSGKGNGKKGNKGTVNGYGICTGCVNGR